MRKAFDSLLAAALAVGEAAAGAIWLFDGPPGAPSHLSLAASRGLPPAAPLPLAERALDQQALAEGIAQAVYLEDPLPARLCVRLGTVQAPLGMLSLYAVSPTAFGARCILQVLAVTDLGAAFLEAARKAADLERTEADQIGFIHITTHELRSPLAVSQTLVRNVLKGYTGAVTEKQHYVFGRISAQLDHLESLVNDLLDLAATRARDVVPEGPVALNGPVGRAVLLFQPRADEKGVALEYHACRDEIVIRATEDGLDRILVNLVGNAVKYTPSGGQVLVGLCLTDDEVFVTVADTGIGIPPEALPHLFDEFYRAPNARAANITGTGLGLAIVKQLVERYQGRVTVESAAGVGTTFTVIFPAYRSAPNS
jgi:signal transduction histidine kinase